MGNNPISAVDPDGGDIIYLNDSKAVFGFGHAAVLIGNDNDGWRYLSMNGTGDGASPSGNSMFADLGDNVYNTNTGYGNDFRGTRLTSTQVIAIVNNSNKNESHHYDRSVRIKTSGFEDSIAYEAAKKQAGGSHYNVFGSSCIDVPQEALASVVANRLNIQSGRDYYFSKNSLSFNQSGEFGFQMLVPNQYFDNFNRFMMSINSNLFNNPFTHQKRTTTITVEPLVRLPVSQN
jgi:hypothetical protein